MLCLMDLEEVMVVEEAWDLDFGGALPRGLMLVWAEGDCQGVGTSSVEQRVYLGHGPRLKLKPIGRQCRRGRHPIPLTERQQLPRE